MRAKRKFVPAKRGWMTAISVIDPAKRRLAANDNVSRAIRVPRLDRRLRVVWLCILVLGLATLLGNAWVAALWGVLGK